MLTSLKIYNSFQFKHIELPLKQVTLLTGKNFVKTNIVMEVIEATGGEGVGVELQDCVDSVIHVSAETSDGKTYKYRVKDRALDPYTITPAIDSGKNINFSRHSLIEELGNTQYSEEVISCLNTLFPFLKIQSIDHLHDALYGFGGFDLSKALGNLLALVTLKNKCILLNYPDTRMNEEAQRIMAELICKYSILNNLQVIINTHSQHILYGLRLSVLDHTIPKENMIINYFYNNEIIPIRINEVGRLEEWPDDFFNETDRCLARLLFTKKT